MIIAITKIWVAKSDILQCQKLWTKVEDISSIRCVIGVNRNLGNGLGLWQTHGEQQETLVTIGNHSQEYWISKSVLKSMLARVDGMIRICFKSEMVEWHLMKIMLIFHYGVYWKHLYWLAVPWIKWQKKLKLF